MTRLIRAWGTLKPEQRLAAAAAVVLLITMFLPWYELQSLNPKTKAIDSRSISAFGDVSFVEAAVFLVAAGVLALLFARAERRDFHMPGSDGLVVLVAGGWATLLIFYRVFSRPSGNGYPVGIQWGFFLAFVAAGALSYAGWRMRASAAIDPPLLRHRPGRGPTSLHDDVTIAEPMPAQAERYRPAVDDDVTVVDSRAEGPSKPHAPAGASAPRSSSSPGSTRRRPRFPPSPSQSPSDQLSFEDAPPERDES
jgi:hypothetical protein